LRLSWTPPSIRFDAVDEDFRKSLKTMEGTYTIENATYLAL